MNLPYRPSEARPQLAGRRLALLGALAESTLGRALGPTERTALDAALSAGCERASASAFGGRRQTTLCCVG